MQKAMAKTHSAKWIGKMFEKQKEQLGALFFIIENINWKDEIHSALLRNFKEKFPEVYKEIDLLLFEEHKKLIVPGNKDSIIDQYIKTDHGRAIIAKAMCSPVRMK